MVADINVIVNIIQIENINVICTLSHPDPPYTQSTVCYNVTVLLNNKPLLTVLTVPPLPSEVNTVRKYIQ